MIDTNIKIRNGSYDKSYWKTINLTVLLDTNLSWKAKGIFYYFSTRPDNWKINQTDLIRRSKNSFASLKSGIKELEENGYLKREITHNDRGHIEWTYTIYLTPQYEIMEKNIKNNISSPYNEKPSMVKPSMVKPSMENQTHSNNNKYKYNSKNKKDVILKNNNIDESQIRQTNPLLDYWNSLDNVMKHKNPNTKIYQKCVKGLRSLRCGTFYCKNPVDPKFLQKHRLPNPKNKKFTNDEIKASMKNLSLLLTGGYGYDNGNGLSWPDDNLRTRLRALSFVDLLWHSRTNKSFFLLVLYNPPQLLKEANAIIPFDPEYYSVMESLIDSKYRPLDVYKKKQLIHRIEQMLKFQKRIIKKHISMQQNFNFQHKIGYEDDPTHFLDTYIEWMTDNVDIPISVKMIGPEGFCWSDFCQYLKTECYCQNLKKGDM